MRGNGQIGFVPTDALKPVLGLESSLKSSISYPASSSAAQPANSSCSYYRTLTTIKPTSILELSVRQGEWVTVTGPGMSSDFVSATNELGKKGQIRKGVLKACAATDGHSAHTCPRADVVSN
jgi:hypothetical protein